MKQKDFTIEQAVVTSVEARFLAELASETFSEEHGAVAGLELTTTLACMDAYK